MSEVAPRPDPAAAPEASRRRTRWRLAALAVLMLALLAVGHATGAAEHLDRERIQAVMVELGPVGFVAFVAFFAIGELVHVPGMVFVAAAIVAYGPVMGFAAGLAGATVSVTVSFWVVRLVGGQPLGAIQRPLVRRILARLEHRPIATVALLRLLFQMLPAINYGLAMSTVRFRDYLVGSVIGLLPVIAVAAFAFDRVFGR